MHSAPNTSVPNSTSAVSASEHTSETPSLFGRAGAAEPAAPAASVGPDYERIQRSGEFVALRRRLRRFVVPMSVLFFVWYMTYVLLAAYAHDFMSTTLFGQINVGIVFGILQFVTTVVITACYVRFANRRIDPHVAEIRHQAGVPEE